MAYFILSLTQKGQQLPTNFGRVAKYLTMSLITNENTAESDIIKIVLVNGTTGRLGDTQNTNDHSRRSTLTLIITEDDAN